MVPAARPRRRSARALVAALALAVLTALPASAAPPIGRTPVFEVPGCSVVSSTVMLKPDGVGTYHGFLRAECGVGQGGMWYLEGSRGTWRNARTPWSGTPIASAHDATGTYLLFESNLGPGRSIFIAKRTPQGAFSTPRKVGTAPDAVAVGLGSMVVTGGRWWAVWGETTGAGEIYQARTLGRVQNRTRVTSNRLDDDQPHLFVRGTTATMYWQRERGTRVATATMTGPWRSRLFSASIERIDASKQVGGTTWLVWQGPLNAARQRSVRVTEVTGTRTRTVTVGRVVSTALEVAHIGVTAGEVYVAWNNGTIQMEKAKLAVRVGGRWSTSGIGGDPGESQSIAALVPSGGRGTLLFALAGVLWAAYE